MAAASGTAHQILITPQNTGLWRVKQTEEAASKVSELLQKDLNEHHVFFNDDHFHNHISHHLLALYGTGAGPQSLQKGYNDNAYYQKAMLPEHEPVIKELESWDHAKAYLGNEKYYPDFLRFFQKEMDKKGWENVLNEYLFKGDEAADMLFTRMYSGFLHPIIQLMYGIEWAQPAIIAMGLAQAAVHQVEQFLVEAEKAAKTSSSADMPPIALLYKAVAADEKLAHAAEMKDSNKIRDGVLVRAREEMLKIVSEVKVKPDQLEERTVEMYNNAVAVATAAAFHPPKTPKFDFFLMHHVNASPIFLTINAQPWLSTEAKVRALEWKIRIDLVEYAGRACPPMSLDSLTSYKPKDQSGNTAAEILSRLHNFEEDGHANKLGRATAICEHISQKFEDKEWLVIKGHETWLKIYHLIVDSVHTGGGNWVRTAGLEEAWKNIPDAKL